MVGVQWSIIVVELWFQTDMSWQQHTVSCVVEPRYEWTMKNPLEKNRKNFLLWHIFYLPPTKSKLTSLLLESKPMWYQFYAKSCLTTCWLFDKSQCSLYISRNRSKVKRNLKKIGAIFGEHNIHHRQSYKDLVNIIKIVIHPKYNPKTFKNDYAILTLGKKVSF